MGFWDIFSSKPKKKHFSDSLETYKNLEFFSLTFPKGVSSSSFSTASKFFNSLHNLNTTVFLGFLAQANVATFHIAAESSVAKRITSELSLLYPDLELRPTFHEAILLKITPDESQQGAFNGILLGQKMEQKPPELADYEIRENAWWCPLNVIDNFSPDPLASLLTIANELKGKELLLWTMAIRPHANKRGTKMYGDLTEAWELFRGTKQIDSQDWIIPSLQKLEEPTFIVQSLIRIQANSREKLDVLTDKFDDFLAQFKGEHNGLGKAKNFYRLFPSSDSSNHSKIAGIAGNHQTISFQDFPDAWMILNCSELATLWHVPNK